MRGSTAIPGAADQIFHIRREIGAPEGTLFAEKVKADANGWEIPFGMKEVPLPVTGPKPRKSLVAYRIEDAPLAPGDDFGGQQQTGAQIVDGKRWPPIDVCKDIVRAIGNAFSEGEDRKSHV